MQMSYNNRFGNNFVGNFSYVYSHCTDGAYTYGGLGGNNGTSAWTNPYDGSREEGNCGFDIRHNLTLNVVYRLPFHGNRAIEGWQISGIESYRTGVPTFRWNRIRPGAAFQQLRVRSAGRDCGLRCDGEPKRATLVQQILLHATCAGNGWEPGEEHNHCSWLYDLGPLSIQGHQDF